MISSSQNGKKGSYSDIKFKKPKKLSMKLSRVVSMSGGNSIARMCLKTHISCQGTHGNTC